MSEIKYFKNFQEYRNYYAFEKNKLQVQKYMIINSMRDNIQQSLVFTLSNNTAYYLSEIEVLEDNEVLPKNQYSLNKIIYSGCKQYNQPLNLELISTTYTDSFSFNRNNYIEIVVKDYKENCNYQLKIKIVDFEDIKPKEEEKKRNR